MVEKCLSLVSNAAKEDKIWRAFHFALKISNMITNIIIQSPHLMEAKIGVIYIYVQCLQLMEIHGLSAVPVVDHERRVLDVYSSSDITFLAKATDADDAIRNVDLPLS